VEPLETVEEQVEPELELAGALVARRGEVLLAVRGVAARPGLTVGLEPLLGL